VDGKVTRSSANFDLIAATQAVPALFPLVGPYLGMRALPCSLDAARP
jgi:hypothetical protein